MNLVFKLLLVISIVLQSIAVAPANTENHQIDIEHLQSQHDHKSDIISSENNLGADEHDVSDCHHCGHCSGSHLLWVLVNTTSNTVKLNSINKTLYQFDQTNYFLDTILRLPIS